MRVLSILIASLALTNWSLGQPTDSTFTHKISFKFNNKVSDVSHLTQSFYDATGQKKWITKGQGHIIIATNKLRLTLLEEEISEKESLECNALRERDSTALKNLWLRDFTLDEPQNELHIGKNTLPYYISLTRVIERFTILDNVVYTSGHEYLQRLKSDGKVNEATRRNYSHMWIKKFGTWKLSTKTYE
jgi:hypothetical protein